MFTTVAKNFAKFLAAYFCLLVAFALSFCVLFPNYQSFNVRVPAAAIVKSLVMMAGEIEYETFIYENGTNLFVFTGHLMIMIFVVLVSIILMNLLVGLAVSDIQVRNLKINSVNGGVILIFFTGFAKVSGIGSISASNRAYLSYRIHVI